MEETDTEKDEDGLSARLEYVLAVRALSRRSWGLAAGRSQSYIGQLIRGDIKGNVSFDVIKDLATAASVDPVWLATGEGEEPTPEDDTKRAKRAPSHSVSGAHGRSKSGTDRADRAERYPSRATVAAMARAQGVDKDVIVGLLEVRLKSESDPGEEFWVDKLAHLKRISKRMSRQLKELADDEAFDEKADV